MNQYQKKLLAIKSRRLSAFDRVKQAVFFIGLLLLSYVILIVGYRGIIELVAFIYSQFNPKLNILLIIFITFSCLSLLFLVFYTIGLALKKLTMFFSGVAESDKNIQTQKSHFYWLVYTCFLLLTLIVITWERKGEPVILYSALYFSITLVGLLGLSMNKPIFTNVFWKIYFFLQLILIGFSFTAYSYLSDSFIYINIPIDMVRIIFIIFIGLFYIVGPIFGIWSYTFNNKPLWIKIFKSFD